MKKILRHALHTTLFSLLTLFPSRSFTQVVEPETLWTKTYGGTGIDIGVSVHNTFEGGYIICGYTGSFGAGGFDAWLLKTDDLGDTVWTKTYGSTTNDYAWWVEQTPDSGYIIAGAANALGSGPSDLWLVKTNSAGAIIWTKIYGGFENDYAKSVKMTRDGGYIVCGASSSFNPGGDCDVYLIKTDSHGDTLWTATYGNTGEDAGLEVQETRDSGYIVVGETQNIPASDVDVYIIKTDSLGDTLWTQQYGKAFDDKAYSIHECAEEGYIVAGYTVWPGLGADIWLIKLDLNGDTLWVKQYGDTGDEEGGSVFQTTDGGYIICGYSNSYGTNYDAVYLLRTDTLGGILWTKTVGGIDTENRGFSIDVIEKGEYIVTGYSYSNQTLRDIFLVRLGKPEGVAETTKQSVAPFISPTIFSGPLTLPLDKTCTVYDITGRTVEPTHLSPGIYYVEIDGVISAKIIKIR